MINIEGKVIARFPIGFHVYEIFEMRERVFGDRYECWRDGSFIISDNYITDIGRALHFPGFLVDEIIAGFYDSEGATIMIDFIPIILQNIALLSGAALIWIEVIEPLRKGKKDDR